MIAAGEKPAEGARTAVAPVRLKSLDDIVAETMEKSVILGPHSTI